MSWVQKLFSCMTPGAPDRVGDEVRASSSLTSPRSDEVRSASFCIEMADKVMPQADCSLCSLHAQLSELRRNLTCPQRADQCCRVNMSNMHPSSMHAFQVDILKTAISGTIPHPFAAGLPSQIKKVPVCFGCSLRNLLHACNLSSQ